MNSKGCFTGKDLLCDGAPGLISGSLPLWERPDPEGGIMCGAGWSAELTTPALPVLPSAGPACPIKVPALGRQEVGITEPPGPWAQEVGCGQVCRKHHACPPAQPQPHGAVSLGHLLRAMDKGNNC